MNYTEIVSALSLNTAIPSTEASFSAVLPSVFAYAEGRITRELDLMAANVRDASSSTTALNRNFNLPTTLGTFLVVDGINAITPAATAPDSGTRVALQPASRDFLDWSWPSTEGATVPQYFAYISQNTASTPTQSQIIFGPCPDAAYRIEVIGKIQPAALSSSNANTWLSDNLPDLYIAACMISLAGYMQDYGRVADAQGMAATWEGQYGILKESAAVYQARARWGGASWTSKQVEPTAVPQRG